MECIREFSEGRLTEQRSTPLREFGFPVLDAGAFRYTSDMRPLIVHTLNQSDSAYSFAPPPPKSSLYFP